MYPPFSSDVTHQKYSGLEERKVKLEGEKEANVKSFLNLCEPRWTPAILSPPILHPHTVPVNCFLPHACFRLALRSSKPALNSDSQSQFSCPLASDQVTPREVLGGDRRQRENGDRFALHLPTASLSVFWLHLCTKGSSLSQTTSIAAAASAADVRTYCTPECLFISATPLKRVLVSSLHYSQCDTYALPHHMIICSHVLFHNTHQSLNLHPLFHVHIHHTPR